MWYLSLLGGEKSFLWESSQYWQRALWGRRVVKRQNLVCKMHWYLQEHAKEAKGLSNTGDEWKERWNPQYFELECCSLPAQEEYGKRSHKALQGGSHPRQVEPQGLLQAISCLQVSQRPGQSKGVLGVGNSTGAKRQEHETGFQSSLRRKGRKGKAVVQQDVRVLKLRQAEQGGWDGRARNDSAWKGQTASDLAGVSSPHIV